MWFPLPTQIRILVQIVLPTILAIAIVALEPEAGRTSLIRGALLGVLGTFQWAAWVRWGRSREEPALREPEPEPESTDTVEVLTQVGHETRTSLSAILGMSRLLLDSPLEESQRDHVQTVRESSEALLVTLNDGLDAARIEAGQLELENEPFELADCIDDVLEVLVPQARERGVEIACFVDRAVPRSFRGDGARLQRILFHLVSNAVRFTQEGLVELEFGVQEIGDSKVELSCRVRDTGVGIPPDRRDSIFKADTLGSTLPLYGSATRGGGLAIGQQVARLMNGDLVLESSRPKMGSCFRLTALLEEIDSEGPQSTASHFAGLAALIVDGGQASRRVAREILEGQGLVCTECEDGRSALGALREAARAGRPFDVVLVSLRLSGMSGERLIGRINGSSGRERTPVLALVEGTADSERRKHGFGEGCEVVEKPLRPERLLQALAAACRLEGLADEAELSKIPHRLDVLVVEDDLANQKAIRLGLEQFPCEVDVASHGDEAVQALTLKCYDVVLMDCRVPLRSGFEAVAEVRDLQSSWAQEIPIIGMAPTCSSRDRERCLQAGMNAVIRLPARPERIWYEVHHWGTCRPTAVTRPELDLADTTEDEALDALSLDLEIFEELRALTGGGPLFEELIELFVADTPGQIDAIEQALRAEDWRQIEQLSRNLKSTCLHLGAAALAGLCDVLEELVASEGARGGAETLLERSRAEFDAVREELAARGTDSAGK